MSEPGFRALYLPLPRVPHKLDPWTALHNLPQGHRQGPPEPAPTEA